MTSNDGRGGTRYMPFCFAEQGVTMLSCELNSERAIHVNIQIVRIYTRFCEMLLLHDEKIEVLFTYLSKFLEKEDKPGEEIGFKRKGK
ncbi:hypothetical protein HDF26_002439 [Pedobacter cryoconitis]|uniref:hypothetical protein n=1 Tax=Pedobacter cryoconitis TaxID=188932 RepID=UPI0016133B38|nr:hypothetical protein [Pedobacter cryoconitis]MBB6271982.1 hypothetical protein [Pedobacter cryoconitis]